MNKLGALFLAILLAACGGGGDSGGSGGSSSSSSGSSGAAPTLSSFSASPAAGNAGLSAILSWTVSGATKLTLQPGSIDVTGKTSYTVKPAATTTYTLQASNDAGSAQATAQVLIYDWSKLAAALDGFLSTASSPPSGSVSGYSFVLFDKTGTLYTRAGGDHTLSTVDMIASASKLPAAAAILTLVDQGKLDLDTPVATYFQNAGNPITWPSDKAAITTRMLLSHTSGLPGLSDTQPNCMNQPASTTLKQCAQDIANTALVSQPGQEFNYGGVDYQVAGYLAVLLSGASSWQAFFNNAIAAPLGGIPSFTYGSPATITNPRIAGGAASNVSDYATILSMIRNNGQYGGKQVLSAAMITQLTTDQIAGLPKANTPFSATAAQYYPGYTLSLFVSAPSLYQPESPGPEFSDPGLYGTTPWFDNGVGYGAVIEIKQDTQTGLDMWNAARPLIVQQLTGKGS